MDSVRLDQSTGSSDMRPGNRYLVPSATCPWWSVIDVVSLEDPFHTGKTHANGSLHPVRHNDTEPREVVPHHLGTATKLRAGTASTNATTSAEMAKGWL